MTPQKNSAFHAGNLQHGHWRRELDETFVLRIRVDSLFGMGWALTGACPGPLYVLVGSGLTVMLVAIASAMAGVWAYALLKARLPH